MAQWKFDLTKQITTKKNDKKLTNCECFFTGHKFKNQIGFVQCFFFQFNLKLTLHSRESNVLKNIWHYTPLLTKTKKNMGFLWTLQTNWFFFHSSWKRIAIENCTMLFYLFVLCSDVLRLVVIRILQNGRSHIYIWTMLYSYCLGCCPVFENVYAVVFVAMVKSWTWHCL